MNKLLQRANLILQAAINSATTDRGRARVEDMMVYVGYAEPGYGTLEGDDVIVTGNFNSISANHHGCDGSFKHTVVDNIPQRVGDVLESADINIEWDDEWASCDDCCRLVRTTGDSYSWTPYYVMGDGHITCGDCAKENADDYLQSLEGNPETANTLDISPEECGYVCIGEFERGYHPGQDSDPLVIARVLEDQALNRFLFNIDSVGQFDARFSVWLHESELEDFDADAFDDSNTDGRSPSATLKRGLEEASRQMSELEGQGVRHATIHGDGSVETKLVELDEFLGD